MKDGSNMMIITQMGIQPNNTMGLLIIYIIYTSLSNSNLIQNFLLHFPIQNFWQIFFSLLPLFFFPLTPLSFLIFNLVNQTFFAPKKKNHHTMDTTTWSFDYFGHLHG